MRFKLRAIVNQQPTTKPAVNSNEDEGQALRDALSASFAKAFKSKGTKLKEKNIEMAFEIQKKIWNEINGGIG